MNVAVLIEDKLNAASLPLARLQSLLEGDKLGQAVARAAGKLGLNHLDVAQVHAERLHPRSNGGFVVDVTCGRKALFIEVATGTLHDLSTMITHRHKKQQHRLGQDIPLHVHVDEVSACTVRLKGQDELIDGLPATLLHDRFSTDKVRQTRLLAHRLHRRAVISVTQGDNSQAIIKAYKKGSQKADVAVALHAMLGHTAFGERSPVRVPKITAQCADWPGYMMEHVGGTAVAELSGADRCDGMRLAGEALGRLHRLPLRLQSQHTSGDELSILQSWITLISQLFSQRSQALSEALTHVSRLFESSQTDVSECIVHRDFHEGQVLAASDTASLIDFDTACNGEPAQDIGNFLAHLDFAEARQGIHSPADAEEFLAAYEAAHAVIPATRIRAHRAATLLRLSCIHAISATSRKAAEALTERALSI
jgi:Ser/Thr protein kinase RdoA (MazF antagonist)